MLRRKVAVAIGNIRNARFREFVQQAIDENDSAALEYAAGLTHFPVEPEEFFLSSNYLNLKDEIYPEVLQAAIELNSGDFTEGALVGSPGSAKSYLANISQAYVLYKLSCLKNPHKVYGLAVNTEIMIVFQAIKKELAKELGYDRFRPMIEDSPYFRKYFPHDRSRKAKMLFPHNVQALPIGALQTSAIGKNIISGTIEEANFGEVVEKSKKSVSGGIFDQGRVLYKALASRRRSRFHKNGNLPGLILVVSSRNYPGQLTDDMEAEAEQGAPIYIYDKTAYDVKPEDYSDEKFPLFVGDEARKPRILEPGEVDGYEAADIKWVPEDLRDEFEKDMTASIREIAGVATLARKPYFSNSDAINRAFGKRPSIFVTPDVDFEGLKCEIDNEAVAALDKTKFRAAHIDLAVSGDSAGLTIAHIDGFESVDVINRDDTLAGVEVFPRFIVDGSLQIMPPPKGQINFEKVRKIIYVLTAMGVPIKWISFDSFQSVDSIQQLRQKGYISGRRSVDTKLEPWVTLRRAFSLDRIELPEHEHLKREILSLELDPKKKKVDHVTGSSKDVADSLAGACYQLYTRRELWIRGGVAPGRIPYMQQDTPSAPTAQQ